MRCGTDGRVTRASTEPARHPRQRSCTASVLVTSSGRLYVNVVLGMLVAGGVACSEDGSVETPTSATTTTTTVAEASITESFEDGL